jgi:hypothetical protein
MKSHKVRAGAAVLVVARFGTQLNSADPPAVVVSQCPDRTLAIFEQSIDVRSIQRRVSNEAAVLPAGKAVLRADPERSISGCEQRSNRIRMERLICQRLRRHRPHAIKTQQAQFRAEP